MFTTEPHFSQTAAMPKDNKCPKKSQALIFLRQQSTRINITSGVPETPNAKWTSCHINKKKPAKTTSLL
jgi:hypothetical protein